MEEEEEEKPIVTNSSPKISPCFKVKFLLLNHIPLFFAWSYLFFFKKTEFASISGEDDEEESQSFAELMQGAWWFPSCPGNSQQLKLWPQMMVLSLTLSKLSFTVTNSTHQKLIRPTTTVLSCIVTYEVFAASQDSFAYCRRIENRGFICIICT